MSRNDDNDNGNNKDGHPSLPVRDAAFLRAEAEIAATRERLALSVMALETQITRAIDWRGWIRRRPMPALAGAFAVGWLLGARR